MQLGTVIGHATSTIKHPSLNGWRLAVVQPLGVKRQPEADPIVAVDKFGAGAGQTVILNSDGKGAREMIGDDKSPVRFCDRSGSWTNDRHRPTARRPSPRRRRQRPRHAPLPRPPHAAGRGLHSGAQDRRRLQRRRRPMQHGRDARACAAERHATTAGASRRRKPAASPTRRRSRTVPTASHSLVVRRPVRAGQGRADRRSRRNRRFARSIIPPTRGRSSR